MDIFDRQQHLNNLKAAKNFYQSKSAYYNDVAVSFDELIQKIEYDVEENLNFLYYKSTQLKENLNAQTLELRRNFVKVNAFNEYDLQNLSSVLQPLIGNNIPALELFPGTGQFLPFVVASEPLYFVDRYIEICDEAANILNNEFYATRRLRKYAINDFDTSNLPQKSFGLVYCFNEFFSADTDYVIRWGKRVFDLLFNGGKYVFNFLPNDQVWAQENATRFQFSIIDYKKVINELVEIGFVFDSIQFQPVKSSYIILQKPGDAPPRVKISGSSAEIIDI